MSAPTKPLNSERWPIGSQPSIPLKDRVPQIWQQSRTVISRPMAPTRVGRRDGVVDEDGREGSGILGQVLVGSLVAGVAAYLSLRFLTHYFHTHTLTPFGIYCTLPDSSASHGSRSAKPLASRSNKEGEAACEGAPCA